MSLSDLISVDAIIAGLRGNSKKAVLQEMSDRASLLSGLPARDLYEAVLQRERLGSTGVGKGIAIPHGKLAGCSRLFGVFARLERPIDFDALDGEPVEFVFMMIAPESAGADHLKALASVARVLRDPHTISGLRGARDAARMMSLLVDNPASHAA